MSPARSSTPWPAPCSSTRASAPISSTWPGPSTRRPAARCHAISDAQYALLEQLEPIPASIQNSRYDILAHNRTFGLLFCDLSEVPREDMNCMILAYTNPQWRSSMVQLEETTRFLAAKLRAAMADHLADPAWKTLLKRLRTESAEFRAAWERHEVVETFNKRKQYRNAHVGLLDVDHTDLWLGPRHGPRMVTYVPVDEETRRRLEKLHAMALERERAGA